MTIKVGDVVTWRSGKSSRKPGSRGEPIGIANCRVLELGEAEGTGAPAAKLKLPAVMGGDEVGALVADLEQD